MESIDRRGAIAALGAAAALPLFPMSALAAAPGFAMWRDPGCGCCLEWAKRMEAAFGRKLAVVDAPDMASVKRAQGVPPRLHSCHTALIGGYVIEGHVPPADAKRLIASRNRSIRGLAVPGMPAGAPGMDVGHNARQAYKVYAFADGGRLSVYAEHR